MAKVSKGRRLFSSAVGRPSSKKHYNSSKTSTSSSTHQYGEEFPQQSLLCRKRDDFRCRARDIGMPKCNNRFPPPLHHLLVAHHIVPWIKSKNNSLRNLITLCHDCHSKEHGRTIGYAATEAQKRYSKKL